MTKVRQTDTRSNAGNQPGLVAGIVLIQLLLLALLYLVSLWIGGADPPSETLFTDYPS